MECDIVTGIVAPMVRIGTLPMRKLAHHYGATMVYTEEMIALKIAKCYRHVNHQLGVIEYIQGKKGEIKETKEEETELEPQPGLPFQLRDWVTSSSLDMPPRPTGKSHPQAVFTTAPGEPVVFQIGTSNAVDALRAASLVARDVRAIDINMGCPKRFSLQGGMGAALLSTPHIAHDILSTLKRNLNIPITCKIRLLPTEEETIKLLETLRHAGADAIAIHARRVPDRPRHPALPSQLTNIIAEWRRLTPTQQQIPILYNGDVYMDHEIEKMRMETGGDGIMCARGAMWNASIFRRGGMLPLFDVVRSYTHIAYYYDNHYVNTKYTLMEMLKGHISTHPLFETCNRTKSYQQLYTQLPSLQKIDILTSPYHPPPIKTEERPADLYACHDAMHGTHTATATSTNTKTTQDGKRLSKKEKKYMAKMAQKGRKHQQQQQHQVAPTSTSTSTSPSTSAPTCTSTSSLSSSMPTLTSTSISTSATSASSLYLASTSASTSTSNCTPTDNFMSTPSQSQSQSQS